MAKNKKVTRAPRGIDRPYGRQPPKTEGLATMTSEIIYLTARFQRWVNQLVARHLEAEATKFAR